MIARAIVNEDREFAATKWSDAWSSRGEESSWGGVRFGNRIVDSREVSVNCIYRTAPFGRSAASAAQTGWYYGDWLWQVRGFLDLLFGGVGVRRGRRDPELLQVGDTLDFWRVEAFENNQRLLLAAEMRLPGRAWLEFAVEDTREEHFDSPNCDLRSHRCCRIDVLVRVVSGAQVDVRKDAGWLLPRRAMTRKPKPNEITGLYSQRSQANRSPRRAA